MISNQNEIKIYDVAILGGGPAGASAALYTARANHSTIVIDKGIRSGALGITENISNYPGVKGPVAGKEIVKTIQDQALQFGAIFINDRVTGIDFSSDNRAIFTAKDNFFAKTVIIATGSSPKKNSCKGEKEFLGRGVSYCATCDGDFYQNKIVAVIGNSDEALEELLYLSNLVKTIFLISQTNSFKADPSLIAKVESLPNVIIKKGHILDEILGEKKVTKINIKDSTNNDQIETIDVNGVFIYLPGSHSIADFFPPELSVDSDARIIVKKDSQTTIPGIFAAGDVVSTRIKQAVIAAGDGVCAAMFVDKFLRNNDKVRLDWIHS